MSDTSADRDKRWAKEDAAARRGRTVSTIFTGALVIELIYYAVLWGLAGSFGEDHSDTDKTSPPASLVGSAVVAIMCGIVIVAINLATIRERSSSARRAALPKSMLLQVGFAIFLNFLLNLSLANFFGDEDLMAKEIGVNRSMWTAGMVLLANVPLIMSFGSYFIVSVCVLTCRCCRWGATDLLWRRRRGPEVRRALGHAAVLPRDFVIGMTCCDLVLLTAAGCLLLHGSNSVQNRPTPLLLVFTALMGLCAEASMLPSGNLIGSCAFAFCALWLTVASGICYRMLEHDLLYPNMKYAAGHEKFRASFSLLHMPLLPLRFALFGITAWRLYHSHDDHFCADPYLHRLRRLDPEQPAYGMSNQHPMCVGDLAMVIPMPDRMGDEVPAIVTSAEEREGAFYYSAHYYVDVYNSWGLARGGTNATPEYKSWDFNIKQDYIRPQTSGESGAFLIPDAMSDLRRALATNRSGSAALCPAAPRCRAGHVMAMSTGAGLAYLCSSCGPRRCGSRTHHGERWVCAMCREHYCYKCKPRQARSATSGTASALVAPQLATAPQVVPAADVTVLKMVV